MKVNLRDNQVAAWQRLAELIGGRTPADAIAYIGARYLPALIDQLDSESLQFPVVSDSSKLKQTLPTSSQDELNCSKLERTEPSTKQPATLTEFDELFDSIGA